MILRLRKRNSDFKKRKDKGEQWYDTAYDYDLIVASFASQYGIRLAQEDDISYSEWARLLSGLLPDTPLGRVVQVRAETDKAAIKRFSKHEHKIRKDWATFRASKQKQEAENFDIAQLQEMLKKMFPSKEVRA